MRWVLQGLNPSYGINPSYELIAHASRRSRRSLLAMRLLCFNKLNLILRSGHLAASRRMAASSNVASILRDACFASSSGGGQR